MAKKPRTAYEILRDLSFAYVANFGSKDSEFITCITPGAHGRKAIAAKTDGVCPLWLEAVELIERIEEPASIKQGATHGR